MTQILMTCRTQHTAYNKLYYTNILYQTQTFVLRITFLQQYSQTTKAKGQTKCIEQHLFRGILYQQLHVCTEKFRLRSQTFGLSSCLESALSDTIVFMANAYSSMSKQAGNYSE